jgi:hypothetical protein
MEVSNTPAYVKAPIREHANQTAATLHCTATRGAGTVNGKYLALRIFTIGPFHLLHLCGYHLDLNWTLAPHTHIVTIVPVKWLVVTPKGFGHSEQ